MKKKFLTWIVTALFFVPCLLLLTACNGGKESGFKIVIDDQSFSADNNNEIILDQGTEIAYSAVAIWDDDSEKAIDTSLLTVIDESSILGTTPEPGEYELTFKYGEYTDIVVKIIVVSSELNIPTATTNTFTYNGEEQTLDITGFDASKMTVTGNKATIAGSYTATISLIDKETNSWADGSTEDKTITWTISKAKLTKPTQTNATYTYNNQDQDINLVGFDSNTMTKVSGCTAKNADDYTAVISLKDTANYTWEDESIINLSFEWTINKAQAVAPTHSSIGGEYNPSKTLADYTLDNGFTWVDDSEVPTVSNNTFDVIYNPDANNYIDAETTITLNIAKAQAVAPSHNALSGTYDPNKKLINYYLDNYFSWVDDTIVPVVNTNKYSATYNPDSDNYLDAIVDITVNIAKAQAVAPSHDSISGTYNPAKTLADYTLDEGFAWTTQSLAIVPQVDTYSAQATYNPDVNNYISDEVEIYLDISPIAIAKPTLKEGVIYIYSGEEQEVQLDNYDSNIMSITGNTATNASTGSGEHAVVTITNNNYVFNDSTSSVTINWFVIAKTPTITLSRSLEKGYDGLAINNPRITLSDEVSVSYKFYWHNGFSWQEITREDIIEVGKYKIEIETDVEENYARATKTEEFFIYYDISKLDIEITEESRYSLFYTGSEIRPEVAVIVGRDNYGDPILLDEEMYTVTYDNNTNYYDDSTFKVEGVGEYCRGSFTDHFTIQPKMMFSTLNVEGKTVDIVEQNTPIINLDQQPAFDMYVRLALASLYNECGGKFTYTVYDEDNKPILSKTLMPANLEFIIPKEGRNVAIEHYKNGNSNTIINFYINIEESQSIGNEYNIDSIKNLEHLELDTDYRTILALPAFEGTILTAIQETVADSENCVLNSRLTEEGYTLNSVTQEDNTIVFTCKADGKEDVTVEYEIITSPRRNSGYISISPEVSGLSIQDNEVVISEGFDGNLETILTTVMSDSSNYRISEQFANGYAYSSFDIENDTLTITLTKAKSNDIVLTYDIVDLTKIASTFINYVDTYNVENIFIDIYEQKITLQAGFDGTTIDIVNELIRTGKFHTHSYMQDNGEGNPEVINPYNVENATISDNIITLEITYTPVWGEETYYTYYVDFTVIDESEGYCLVESFDHVNINYDRKFLTFNNSNYIKITDVINLADVFYISFDSNGGITNWMITKGSDKVVSYTDIQSQVNYPYNVAFENIPGAGTYTLTMYRGAITDVYTIEIESYDDTPYFKFSYGLKDYVFNMNLSGEVKYVLDIDTYTPVYLYTYLGEIPQGIDTITISIDSLVNTAYDQDKMRIEDFGNVQLKVLEDGAGRKYSLMYGTFEGREVPIYFYHYDKDVQEGGDIQLKFANKNLSFSKTPVTKEEVDYYGDFTLSDFGGDPMFVTTITKSELDYIDGDTTINLQVNMNVLTDILVYNVMTEDMLMGCADHSGIYTVQVMEIGGAPTIIFGMSDMAYTSYPPLMIQIVDDVEE